MGPGKDSFDIDAFLYRQPEPEDSPTMTNDELEAVEARLRDVLAKNESVNALIDAQFGKSDQSPLDLLLTDIPALLDEVERLRSLVGELEFLRAEDEASFRNTEARATRAEAHAERLAGALELMADRAVEDAGCNPSHAWWDALVDARSALSAYRSEKDEACSRPADALDAPVQPTSSHLGNGVDQ